MLIDDVSRRFAFSGRHTSPPNSTLRVFLRSRGAKRSSLLVAGSKLHRHYQLSMIDENC